MQVTDSGLQVHEVTTGYFEILDDTEQTVAVCEEREEFAGQQALSTEDARRYATLFAAAPELLACVQEMHRTLTAPSRQLLDSTRRELAPWLPMLRNVLAKVGVL